MKVYLDKNVYEATKERIQYLCKEFENLVVNVSGGKDSTALLHMVKSVADELDRTINLLWIDQEAEWKATEEMVRKWMYMDDVNPYWMQIPMRITNATSDTEEYLHCWNPDEKELWMREKDPISIKENVYGTERFHKLFGAIYQKEFGGETTAVFSGVRAEESPARLLGLTTGNTYKGITWGRQYPQDGLYTFYPIYDWSYTDVWKTIHDNNLEYNKLYDFQYQKGIPLQYMRVSNLHHETAVRNLSQMQEFEPETHNKLVKRIGGIDSATKFGVRDYFPDELPFMFKSWREYRNFLLEKMVDKEEHKKRFKYHFLKHDLEFEHLPEKQYQNVLKQHVRGILANDWEGDSIIHNAWLNYECSKTAEVRKMKEEYLKEQGIWDDLVEEGVIRGG